MRQKKQFESKANTSSTKRYQCCKPPRPLAAQNSRVSGFSDLISSLRVEWVSGFNGVCVFGIEAQSAMSSGRKHHQLSMVAICMVNVFVVPRGEGPR